MKSDLTDLVVWITGASGGIGLALADAFAEEGARLVLHANSQPERLERWVRERRVADRALVHTADVTEPRALDELVDHARAQFGRVDVCIANAGVWPDADLPLHDMSIERIRHVLDVNLMGAMWTARAFLRGLAADGPRTDGRAASLCFIGSTAGRFGEAGHVEYATSKAALHGLLRSLKNEIVHLDPFGRVNMVEPGWTVTPMAADELEHPGTIERVLTTTPLRQLARPRDIANAVVFLSAPGLARHVTGEVLTLAGGMEGRTQWQTSEIDAARVRSRLNDER